VLVEPWERFEQRVDERAAELHARPLLQRPEIQVEADDGEVGVDAGAEIDGGFEELHGRLVREAPCLDGFVRCVRLSPTE